MVLGVKTCQLTSSRLMVARKSLCLLSPEPVQMYPIFLGLISEGVNGGLSSGGVGIWRMGRGGAISFKGSVTPGMAGMSGGRLMPRGSLLSLALPAGEAEEREASWHSSRALEKKVGSMVFFFWLARKLYGRGSSLGGVGWVPVHSTLMFCVEEAQEAVSYTHLTLPTKA